VTTGGKALHPTSTTWVERFHATLVDAAIHPGMSINRTATVETTSGEELLTKSVRATVTCPTSVKAETLTSSRSTTTAVVLSVVVTEVVVISHSLARTVDLVALHVEATEVAVISHLLARTADLMVLHEEATEVVATKPFLATSQLHAVLRGPKS